MQKKKIVGSLLVTTFVATSVVLAQDGGPGMPPEGRPEPGIMGKIMRTMGEERRENRQEFRQDMKEARGEFREDMKARHDYMMGSSTSGMATPTPWKNFRDNMKDARNDFKDNMKDMRDEMRDGIKGRMASITDVQAVSIAGKLGISVETLRAQLASGTPLRAIIGNKISKEDMMQIMPPMYASGTSSTTRPWMDREERREEREERREERRGFFNSFRNMFFGGNSGNEGSMTNGDYNMETGTEVNVNAEANVQVQPGVRGFFKRFFGF